MAPQPSHCASCGRPSEASVLFFVRGAVGLCGACAATRAHAEVRDTIPRTDRATFRPDVACGWCGLVTGFGVAFREHTICESCIEGAFWVATASWEDEDPCTFCEAPAEEGVARIALESVVCCQACVERMAATSAFLVGDRDRPGLPHATRCTGCGTNVARAFVWGARGLGVCDRCIAWWRNPDVTPPPTPGVPSIDGIPLPPAAARGAIEMGAGAPAVEALVELMIEGVKSGALPALPTFWEILGLIAANRCVASKRYIARMSFLMASPLAKAGRIEHARAAYERAIALYEPYVDDGEEAPLRNLAAACINMAVLTKPGPVVAEELLTKAIAKLHSLDPMDEAAITDFEIARDALRRVAGVESCSFCGKSQREVKKILRGDHACLCDECLGLCNDILAELPMDSSSPRRKGPTICSLCGADDGRHYISGPRCFICDGCVQNANDTIVEEVERALAEEER